MAKDELETDRAKRKFINEIREGLGEEIIENPHVKPKEKTFTENLLFRLKRVFG
tara:strand:+ start:99 stop:260 length:162 start_codon:yes stop_codon:yes gene_type:complete